MITVRSHTAATAWTLPPEEPAPRLHAVWSARSTPLDPPPARGCEPLTPGEIAECQAAYERLIAKGYMVRTADGLRTTNAGRARLDLLQGVGAWQGEREAA